MIRTRPCPSGNERMKRKRLPRRLETGRGDSNERATHRFRFGGVARALQLIETKREGNLKQFIIFGDCVIHHEWMATKERMCRSRMSRRGGMSNRRTACYPRVVNRVRNRRLAAAIDDPQP